MLLLNRNNLISQFLFVLYRHRIITALMDLNSKVGSNLSRVFFYIGGKLERKRRRLILASFPRQCTHKRKLEKMAENVIVDKYEFKWQMVQEGAGFNPLGCLECSLPLVWARHLSRILNCRWCIHAYLYYFQYGLDVDRFQNLFGSY